MEEQSQKVAAPITDEIATAAKDIDIFAGYLGRLENPDPVLRTEARGKGLKLYDEVDRDAHAGSVLQTRRLAVASKEWEVLPAEEQGRGEKIADFVKAALSNIGLTGTIGELMQAVLYGFYAAEVMWTATGGNWLPAKLIAKHPRRFVFTDKRELRLLTPSSMIDGEEVPQRKFVVFSWGDSDNPYGKGLGQKLWWPVWFKKNGIKFWLVFLEKFGNPTPVGKYPPGTAPDQQKALLEAIEAIQNETGIKIPANMAIELLEAKRSGDGSYESLCKYFDSQISKAVLGQTLTTEISGTGSYAAAQTHEEVRQDLVKADADALCEMLNATLVRWIVDLNFGPQAAYPTLWLRTEPEADLNALADRDKKLAVDIGVPIDEGYWYETYGVPRPEDADAGTRGRADGENGGAKAPTRPSRPSARPSVFANPERGKSPLGAFNGPVAFTADQQAIEGLKAALFNQGLDASRAMLAPIIAAINSSSGFDEAKAKIMAAAGDMDDAALTELLAQALFAADCWGRINGAANGR